MIGFASILRDEYAQQLDSNALALIGRVVDAGARMSAMIDGLLAIARDSQVELRHRSVDLSQLAQLVWDELEQSGPDRRVRFDVAPGLVAQGDSTLLRSVLQNLLHNARKYTAHSTDPQVTFGLHGIDGERAFYVSDNGVGFDMAHAHRLFGLFQRVHSESEFKGIGIGLASAHRIVARHGGRMWAQAQPNGGATFYFTLGS
jgi:light-regulated signal transduction histidine kinase (bacteriophytochrome)